VSDLGGIFGLRPKMESNNDNVIERYRNYERRLLSGALHYTSFDSFTFVVPLCIIRV